MNTFKIIAKTYPWLTTVFLVENITIFLFIIVYIFSIMPNYIIGAIGATIIIAIGIGAITGFVRYVIVEAITHDLK